MADPIRLKDLRDPSGQPADEAARLLRETGKLRPFGEAARRELWRRFQEQTEAPRGIARWRIAVAAPLAACAMAALALFVVTRPPSAPPGWTAVSLPKVAALQVAEGSELQVPPEASQPASERHVVLSKGTLRARVSKQRPERPFVVVTRQVRVVVVGTLFDVHSDEALTTVRVDEGTVRVESAHGSVLVNGGEEVRSDDARLSPPPPPAPAPAGETAAADPSPLSLRLRQPAISRPSVDRCDRAGSTERKACLQRLAKGSGLAAQNALYALGLLAREQEKSANDALAWWRQYQQRFPSGALAPEVELAALDLLVTEQRYDEVLRSADLFARRNPGDPRLPEVLLLRANVLCVHRKDPRLAGASYAEAIRRARAPLRGEALFSKAVCELMLGDAGARKSLERYLAEDPAGTHVAEARRLLAKQ